MAEYRYIHYAFRLYIRDLYEVEEQTVDATTYYKFLNMQMKKFQIHGVLTNIFQADKNMIKIQLSDATASINVHYQLASIDSLMPYAEKLNRRLNYMEESGKNVMILRCLANKIEDRANLEFNEGDCVLAIGKISSDNMNNERVFIAFEIYKTSLNADLVWMMELNNLYENHYQVIS